tara:strand:- start:3621 stop:4040 length:420 start_codon:yes stop_codon:yes gene_type:complete
MQLAVLSRLKYSDKQILGHLSLFDETDEVFSCKSLELPDLDNQTDISCIPTGEYICIKRYSPGYGWHYLVKELDGEHVKGREWILIHFGNYFYNTLGCILLGQALSDINGDGLRDVTDSKRTMNQLNRAANNEFKLRII